MASFSFDRLLASTARCCARRRSTRCSGLRFVTRRRLIDEWEEEIDTLLLLAGGGASLGTNAGARKAGCDGNERVSHVGVADDTEDELSSKAAPLSSARGDQGDKAPLAK